MREEANGEAMPGFGALDLGALDLGALEPGTLAGAA